MYFNSVYVIIILLSLKNIEGELVQRKAAHSNLTHLMIKYLFLE